MEKKRIGQCPLCGGDVVKTAKGYRCVNNTGGAAGPGGRPGDRLGVPGGAPRRAQPGGGAQADHLGDPVGVRPGAVGGNLLRLLHVDVVLHGGGQIGRAHV